MVNARRALAMVHGAVRRRYSKKKVVTLFVPNSTRRSGVKEWVAFDDVHVVFDDVRVVFDDVRWYLVSSTILPLAFSRPRCELKSHRGGGNIGKPSSGEVCPILPSPMMVSRYWGAPIPPSRYRPSPTLVWQCALSWLCVASARNRGR